MGITGENGFVSAHPDCHLCSWLEMLPYSWLCDFIKHVKRINAWSYTQVIFVSLTRYLGGNQSNPFSFIGKLLQDFSTNVSEIDTSMKQFLCIENIVSKQASTKLLSYFHMIQVEYYRIAIPWIYYRPVDGPYTSCQKSNRLWRCSRRTSWTKFQFKQ